MNPNPLITSPRPYSQTTLSPLFPPQQQRGAFLTHGPNHRDKARLKVRVRETEWECAHLWVWPRQRTLPSWLPDSWRFSLQKIIGTSLVTNWTYLVTLTWGDVTRKQRNPVCSFSEKGHSLVKKPCLQNSNHLSGSHSHLCMESWAIRHLRKTFNMK